MIRSQLHGHQNRLRHVVPPPVNRRPYNTITIDHVYGNPEPRQIQQFTPRDIYNYFIAQQGLAFTFAKLDEADQDELASRFNFRLRRIDAYVMPTGGDVQRPSVFLDVASLIPQVSDEVSPTAPRAVAYPLLKRIEDVGNLSNCAKVSYTYPLHMADTILNPIANFNFAAVSANVANVSMRFYIDWSFGDTSTPLP